MSHKPITKMSVQDTAILLAGGHVKIKPQGTPFMEAAAVTDWGCVGKASYENRGQAAERLRKQKNIRGRGQKLESYKCRVCGAWHVGNVLA